MGPPGKQDVKRTQSLFIANLKVYQEDHKKLEVVNELYNGKGHEYGHQGMLSCEKVC